MYLTDEEIDEWARNGGIVPYNPEHLNPASIDLTLGNEWQNIEFPGLVMVNSVISIYSEPNPNSRLHDPTAILAITQEWVNIPDNMVGQIKLKTTPTRMGLGHPIADWIDPGYSGKLTLMLSATKNIKLPVGIRIVQLVLSKLDKPVAVPYGKKGHYQFQQSPTSARSDYYDK